jgi:hypothetical protein
VLGNSAYNATPVLFDPDFDLAVLRTDAPLGPALAISPNLVSRGTQAAILGYPEDGGLTIGAAGVTEEVTAIGKDIYNSGSVTRGVYALDANVLPGNSGGPLLGAGGQVIGVVFSRSTVYQDVGYALTSPGVLSRVQEAERHHPRSAPDRASRAEPARKNEPMSQRIEDYAVIGDLHSAALVGIDGSIDWLCLPHFDSPSCFARLLGTEDHGFWRIAPAGGPSAILATRRWYRPDTLVVETEYDTATGTVRVTDCMPVREGHPHLVRSSRA